MNVVLYKWSMIYDGRDVKYYLSIFNLIYLKIYFEWEIIYS